MAEIIQNAAVMPQLNELARVYGTTPLAILELNNLTSVDQVNPLDILQMPEMPLDEQPVTPAEDLPSDTNLDGSVASPLLDDDDAMLEDLFKPKNEAETVPPENLGPQTGGFQIGGETLTIDGETSTAIGEIPPEPETTSGGGTTTTTPTVSEMDFGVAPAETATVEPVKTAAQPPAKPAIPEAEAAVVDATAGVAPAPGVSESAVGQIQAPFKISEAVAAAVTNPEDKNFLRDELKELDDLKIPKLDQTEYDRIGRQYDTDIKDYDKKLEAISAEEMEPRFKGWDKFMAVLGAALGAYGSAMTGAPNYAMQIINAEIDRDQEAFLNSQEIRSKALHLQRQDLITRRGEILQLMVNKFNAAMQTYQGEVQKTRAEATLKKLQEEIQTNKDQFRIEVALQADEQIIQGQQFEQGQDLQRDIAAGKIEQANTAAKKKAAEKAAEKAEDDKKYKRELLVESITLTDENGKLKVYDAYLTATKKEGEKHRESWSQTTAISKILDDIDKVGGTAGAFMPGSLSNTRTSLENLSSQLIVHLKELYGMGAHFTEYEQALVRQQTPTDALFEQFKVWQQKSKDLRRQLIMKHEARVGSQGGSLETMSTTSDQPETPTGLKKGFAKK